MTDDAAPPLVVDLDGTLIRTDLLLESFFALARYKPVQALRSLSPRKALLKSRLAAQVAIDWDSIPYNETLLAFLREEKSRGRHIYLASASHRTYVEQVAAKLGLFDGIFASDENVNLKAEAKADTLCRAFGENGFDYIGDSLADIPVWRRARQAYSVPLPGFMLARIRRAVPHLITIGDSRTGLAPYARVLRPHQWLKNLLLFVPPVAAHQLGAAMGNLPAFVSFSLCASSVYILNDLLDMPHDREHPSKRLRPIPSGGIPLMHTLPMLAATLGGAFLLCLTLPSAFFLTLLAYYVMTLSYSLAFKRMMVIDVIMLACLYGMRLIAGGASAAVPLSPWLAAFALFFFLCMALVKRCTELRRRMNAGSDDPPGRAYRLSDVSILEAMAAASGYVSVMILALYINSAAVAPLYRHPDHLWLLCIGLACWISRVLLLTHRGDVHDDPVIFAVTDRVSLGTFALLAGVVISSI